LQVLKSIFFNKGSFQNERQFAGTKTLFKPKNKLKIKEQVKVSEGEFYVDFGKYDYAFNFVLVEEREII
jgi:hypothetical protein